VADGKSRSTATQILDYLSERPTAADTVQGIAEWWIGDAAAGDIITVETVLHELKAKNLVQVRPLTDGTQIWSAGPNLTPKDKSRGNG
jgi:hypothetical protein